MTLQYHKLPIIETWDSDWPKGFFQETRCIQCHCESCAGLFVL